MFAQKRCGASAAERLIRIAMKPIHIPEKRWDFYDPSSTGLGEFKLVGGALCFISVLSFVSFWDTYFHLKLLLICCFLCPAILLTLPRLARSAFFAYQGAPIISFNEQGLFARRWSYLGWINWRDVMSVEITSDCTGLRHRVEVKLTDGEIGNLAFSDRVSRMFINGLERLLLSGAENQNTLIVTSNCELTCTGADFLTTINRVLLDAHVPCTCKQNFPTS
jgi:hypothetical protein